MFHSHLISVTERCDIRTQHVLSQSRDAERLPTQDRVANATAISLLCLVAPRGLSQLTEGSIDVGDSSREPPPPLPHPSLSHRCKRRSLEETKARDKGRPIAVDLPLKLVTCTILRAHLTFSEQRVRWQSRARTPRARVLPSVTPIVSTVKVENTLPFSVTLDLHQDVPHPPAVPQVSTASRLTLH